MAEHFLPFGKHKGTAVRDAPTDYLTWMSRTCKLSAGLHNAIRSELLARGVRAADLPPERRPRPVVCLRCGRRDYRVSWQEQADGRGRVLRADCVGCGRFITYLPTNPADAARADAARSPTGLLDALVQAEQEGVDLVCRGGRVQLNPWDSGSDELRAMVRQHQHSLLRHLPRPTERTP